MPAAMVRRTVGLVIPVVPRPMAPVDSKSRVSQLCDVRHTGRMAASVGPVRTFLEPDYQYGVGPLRLRVERVDRAHPVLYDGENWYPVEGVRISANGDELGRRHVLVRGRRLTA